MCVYHGTGNIVVGNISLSIRHHFLENNLKASEQLNLKNLSGKVMCICYSKFIFPNILYFVCLGSRKKNILKVTIKLIYCLVALICIKTGIAGPSICYQSDNFDRFRGYPMKSGDHALPFATGQLEDLDHAYQLIIISGVYVF